VDEAEADGAESLELLEDWQPLWHPLATRQYAAVLPQ
jgi:hypothetical protein